MKKISQNYNSVYLIKDKTKEIIIKRFKYEFTWKNETQVIEILKNFGFPVPEILESSFAIIKLLIFKNFVWVYTTHNESYLIRS